MIPVIPLIFLKCRSNSEKSFSTLNILLEMFIDYKNLVLRSYNQKKEANELSMRLINPTPAGLREECLSICRERYDQKDERMLKAVFGPANDLEAHMSAIYNYEIDRFRPLVNFLNGRTAIRDDNHVELLAWLIDFQWRPFVFGRDYSDQNEEIASLKSKVREQDRMSNSGNLARTGDGERSEDEFKEGQVKDGELEILTGEKDGEFGRVDGVTSIPAEPLAIHPALSTMLESRLRKLTERITSKRAIISAILILFIGIVYCLGVNEVQQRCMYWTGDHYQAVSCNQKLINTSVIALDSQKLKSFRKIVNWDTISLKSLNTIFYSKIDNTIELFTSDGYHPLHFNRKLKRLTLYMYNTHILPEVLAKQNGN